MIDINHIEFEKNKNTGIRIFRYLIKIMIK